MAAKEVLKSEDTAKMKRAIIEQEESVAQQSLGGGIHLVFGWMLLYATLVTEAVWLFPRNPVSFFLGVFPPRTLSLVLSPEAYQSMGLSGIFDGAGSVVFQFLALLSMQLGGGYKREILWPQIRRKRLRRFLTLIIFLLNPSSWLVREYLVSHDMAIISEAVHSQLGPSIRSSFMKEPYNVQAHITNHYGGQQPIQPDLVLTYKSVSEDEIGCDFHHTPLAIPGDIAMKSILGELWKGNLQLDVYKPAVRRFDKAPIVLHIHGGGWKRGHRRFISFNYHGGLPHYLRSHGYMIVSVSYRLICPPINGRHQIEDVLDATRFIMKHADEWGADPEKIVPLGTSAGGQLAMLLAYKYNMPQIRGVLNFYGISELRAKGIMSQARGFWETYVHAPIFTHAVKKVCSGYDSIAEFEVCMEELSPLNYVSERSPPTISVHTWQDSLVSIQQAFALDRKLKANNVTHIPVITQGNHDCDVFVSGPCAQAAMFAISRLFETHV